MFFSVLLEINVGMLVVVILIFLLVCGLWLVCLVWWFILKVLKLISCIVLFFFRDLVIVVRVDFRVVLVWVLDSFVFFVIILIS